MKKLMFAAAAVAVVGGAYADPLVYQYKASIKQMNLKSKYFTYDKVKYPLYVKYQSTASLKGYLIQDADGATSKAIQALRPAAEGYAATQEATRPQDYGRNTAFLVVQNSKAESFIRFPKILPAVLDAKWIDDKFETAKKGLAEGYLYVGGDVVAGQIRPSLDIYDGILTGGTRTPAKGFISDYDWTSIWLFGKYNGPFFFNSGSSTLENAQAAIDGAQPADLVQPFTVGADQWFFHDTWMNGSGLGYWAAGKLNKPCCGMSGGQMGPMYGKKITAKVLDNLSGNLKGGIFLCTENGTYSDELENSYGYGTLAGLVWEDQFFTQRWDKNGANPDSAGWIAGGDTDTIDLWQDGDLELNTGDVITGTWSIKLTTALKTVAVSATELTDLGAASATEDAKGLRTLLATIKGAASDLSKGKFVFTDGAEIWAHTTELPNHEGDKIPLLTPQFAKYYGLVNFK